MKSCVSLSFLLVALFSSASTLAAEPPFDPFFWLEEVEGKQATEWVKRENAQTEGALQAVPAYASLLADTQALYFAKDRVAFAAFHHGYFWNFWQDGTHKHGLLRRTSIAEYKKANPQWETVLDFDALSQTENENWVYKGASRLDKNSSRALMQLSRGGKDAVEIREFDYSTLQFVKDGFFIPEAKTRTTELNENQVIVGTDFGPGSMTTSGYPRILKLWHRGHPLEQAKTVFEVQPTDLAAGAALFRDGATHHLLFYRTIDFFHQEASIQDADGKLRKLPIPGTAELLAIRGDKLYVQLKESLSLGTRTLVANSVIRVDLQARDLAAAEVIFAAGPRQSIESVNVRSDRIFVSVLDNIRSKVLELKPDGANGWLTRVLPFPDTGIISFAPYDEEDPNDFSMMSYTDHLTPQSQYLVHDRGKDADSYRLELLKSAPARFDSSRFEVVQEFAISRDGTRIPYFVLKAKNLVLDGKNPTILYGYGGFEVSLTPSYSSSIGKLWLERRGVYVIANIRGGGEFGPEWHQAALKHNRQRAFDDFIAVAENLISTKITSPGHLGISGGSNGGLLTGATLVQRPELFAAALVQVPLLDMLRFSKLLAGASWMGEYGDPDDAQDCAHLLSYSPYHNVKAGRTYPKPLFTTSTKDDRVHPGHARKMAARMREQGHPYHFYENTNGGHAGSANLEESAHVTALEFSYFWSRLGK